MASNPLQAITLRLQRVLADRYPERGGQARMAEECGVKQSTLSNILNGRDAQATSLHQIATGLKLNGHWLLTGDGDPWVLPGPPPDPASIPVAGTVGPDGLVAFADDLDPLLLPRGIHAVQIQDDSPGHGARNGQLVMYTDDVVASGDFAVVETTDGHTYLKLVKWIEKLDGWLLQELDKAWDDTPIMVRRSAVRRMRRVWGIRF